MKYAIFKREGQFVYEDVCRYKGEFDESYVGFIHTRATTDKPNHEIHEFPMVNTVIHTEGRKYKDYILHQVVTVSQPNKTFGVIKRLAIDFGDNDFWKTWQSTLELLGNSLLSNSSKDITRQHLCKRINEGINGVYFMTQALYCRSGSEYSVMNNCNYLHINPTNILINDEIENYLKQDGYDQNSEFFIVNIDYNQRTVETEFY